MSIRAVLFDWDGTLVHDGAGPVFPPASAVADYGRRRLGLVLRDEDFERAFQAVLPDYRPGESTVCPRIDGLIASAFTWLGWTVGANDVDACSRVFFEAATARLATYDDARAILPSLRYRGYQVGVVTNSLFPARLHEVRLNQLGLAGYIDTLVSSADVGLAKPHPGPYQKALASLAIEPQEALFVGDRLETDIAGARAAGMRAVLLERSGPVGEAAGYLVIGRLGALNDILGESMASGG